MKKRLLILLSLVLLFFHTGCRGDEEIIRSEDWQDEYPEIYESYMANQEMSETTYGGSIPYDYLERYPNLKTFYSGYGFGEEYARARGHVYALEDVIDTSRPKTAASCLACKTPDFALALEQQGIEINQMNFDDFVNENPDMEPVSCYDCHRNSPGDIDITRRHFTDALEFVEEEISLENQSCGQCHVEYYVGSDAAGVILPWEYGLETENMLDYFEDLNFVDWIHPETGAELLKAQHPEFETYTGSIHDRLGLSCIDCHMPYKREGEGQGFRSHHWTSPLKYYEGLRESCMSCHKEEPEDIIVMVEDVQRDVKEKEAEVSNELLDYVTRLAKAVEDEDINKEDLAALREIHRRAQFTWDMVFVENSQGFHHSERAHKDLDEARALIKRGVEILERYDK